MPIQGLWLENYNGSAGSYLTGLGDGSWQWGTFLGYQPTRRFNLETAYKFNWGADLRLFKQVDVNFDVYYQLRDDILLSGDGLNSAVFGRPSAYVNWGRVASYGVELGVNWVKQINKDLSFDLGT